MSGLTKKIQSYVDGINDDVQFKKQRENFVELENDDALVIGTSQYGDVGFDKNKLLSNTRCLVVGTSGSGKSYLTRNIIESVYNSEFSDDEGNSVTDKVVHLHDPEGEYFTLRDQNGNFDFVILGRGKTADIEINPENSAEFALKSLKHGIHCIIDYTSIPDQDERLSISIAWNEALINAPEEDRKYLFLFIDEAHKFAQKADMNPLSVKSKLALKQIAQTGRKRGIISFLITQRVTHLHPDIIAECNNFLIGRCNVDSDLKRNGGLVQITSPKQQRIFKTLRNEFIATGESFSHYEDEFLSSQLIKCKSNSPTSKHGKKLSLKNPLYYQPSEKVKQWINILKSDIRENTSVTGLDRGDHDSQIIPKDEIVPVVPKDEIKDVRKSPVEKSLNNEFNTTKNVQTMAENIFETWFHIVCYFEDISVQNLYVLSGRDDYNTISAAMEIKAFCKIYKDLFKENGDTIWWSPKTELDEFQKSNIPIAKSDYFINIWKHKLNNITNERILMYLYQDENYENTIDDICEIAHVSKTELKDFVDKYTKTGLVKQIEDCIYLNTIFFHNKIHDNIPVGKNEVDDEDNNDDGDDFEEDNEFQDEFEDEMSDRD